MTDTLYFIARTDIGGDVGQQRVFGVADTEADAAALGAIIAAQRPGEFAVFEGKAVLKLVRQVSPVTAEPV